MDGISKTEQKLPVKIARISAATIGADPENPIKIEKHSRPGVAYWLRRLHQAKCLDAYVGERRARAAALEEPVTAKLLMIPG